MGHVRSASVEQPRTTGSLQYTHTDSLTQQPYVTIDAHYTPRLTYTHIIIRQASSWRDDSRPPASCGLRLSFSHPPTAICICRLPVTCASYMSTVPELCSNLAAVRAGFSHRHAAPAARSVLRATHASPASCVRAASVPLPSPGICQCLRAECLCPPRYDLPRRHRGGWSARHIDIHRPCAGTAPHMRRVAQSKGLASYGRPFLSRLR